MEIYIHAFNDIFKGDNLSEGINEAMDNISSLLHNEFSVAGVSVLNVVNYALICLLVREDDTPSGHASKVRMSRIRATANYVDSMFLCFVSSLFSGLIIRDTGVLDGINNTNILVASVTWLD